MGYSYRDLVAWQKATAMVTEVYRATQGCPREEMFGLTSQLRRSAVSVASNIAEGQGRMSKRVPAVSRTSEGLVDRDGDPTCNIGEFGLSDIQVGRELDGPLGRSKPPSTRTHKAPSTG